MKRIPAGAVAVGAALALAPLWTWLQIAAWDGLAPLDIAAIAARAGTHAVAISLAGLLAGAGVLLHARAGWIGAQAFCGFAIVNDLALVVVDPRVQHGALFAMAAASGAALWYLRLPEVRDAFEDRPPAPWRPLDRSIRVRVPALVQVEDGPSSPGELLDVSRTGAFVALPEAPPLGARCVIAVPGTPGGRPVRARGEVTWVSGGKGRHPPGFGIRFVHSPAPFRKAVRRMSRRARGARAPDAA